MENKDNTSNNPKGLSIRRINYIMMILSIILFIVILILSIRVGRGFNDSIKASEKYISCRDYAQQLEDGSDYLTEQVRLFTVTGEVKYMENYFTEATQTRRRDNAVQELENLDVEGKGAQTISAALEESNKLMHSEYYAMRLAADYFGKGADYLESMIGDEDPLTDEDKALPAAEKLEKSRQLVFNEEYETSKSIIYEDTDMFINDILENIGNSMQNSSDELSKSLKRERIALCLLFIMNTFIFCIIAVLIIRPLKMYIRCIREDRTLEIIGAYEFRYLALTYNDIYEVNAANEAMLKHRAEHDPLTGIMNRGGFDQLKIFLKNAVDPIALLLIDVDKFKDVNDTYGHEVGDRALIRVANILQESFRSTDYPARIGGDEFAVIVTKVDASMQDVIRRKIEDINTSLQNPQDDLPKLSLSVGAAFSDTGYTDDLFNRADVALYDVKEHGRCGIAFHKE